MFLSVAGHPRRGVRPVLLDPLHLHHPQGPLPPRGEGGGPPALHDEHEVVGEDPGGGRRGEHLAMG